MAARYAVAAAGFFVTSGSRPEIGQYDSDGRLQRVLRIEETPIPVSEGEFQTALEASITPAARRFNFADMGPHAFGELSQPVVVPSFDALRVDDDGWLWARIYEVGTRLGRPFDDGRNEWIVFDPYGRARGTVELPAGLEVSEIGSDYILGLRRSELEVEIVEGYRLTRAD